MVSALSLIMSSEGAAPALVAGRETKAWRRQRRDFKPQVCGRRCARSRVGSRARAARRRAREKPWRRARAARAPRGARGARAWGTVRSRWHFPLEPMRLALLDPEHAHA